MIGSRQGQRPGGIDLLFDGSGVSEVAFEDTEHFQVTRDFLNNYPRRLEQLLADNPET